MTVDHLLLTHHHHDHVAEQRQSSRSGWGWRSSPTRSRREELADVDRTIEPGETLEVGGLRDRARCTPRATRRGCSRFVVNGHVFTGDTLFKGSVGGVKAPGSTGFADLKRSIMDVLMKLPPETEVHPGHTDPTTIGDEWEQNPFVRVWRGLDEEIGRALHRLGAAGDAGAVGARLRRRATRPGCAGTSRARTTSSQAAR